MTHIEEGILQGYLDDEVTGSARAEIDSHLESCATCTAELDRMRKASQLFASALRGADVTPPMLGAQAHLVRARRTAIAVPSATPRRAFARAAMFIVGLAAVASAAVPGSPVRGWISNALARAGLLDQPQSAAAPAGTEEAPAVERSGPESAGFFIEPADGRLRVVLTNVKPETQVTVQLTDAARAHVEANGAAARARFRTGPGRLEVVGIESGSIVVQIPRAIQDAIVEQDGRTIFTAGH